MMQSSSCRPIVLLLVSVASSPLVHAQVSRRESLTVALPAQYHSLDTNQDGQIGLYEWPRSDFSSFRKLDLNNDGLLTPRELVKALSSPRSVTRPGGLPENSTTAGNREADRNNRVVLPPGESLLRAPAAPGRQSTATGSVRSGEASPESAVSSPQSPASRVLQAAYFQFYSMDRNQDGKLSPTEMGQSATVVKSDRGIRQRRTTSGAAPAGSERSGSTDSTTGYPRAFNRALSKHFNTAKPVAVDAFVSRFKQLSENDRREVRESFQRDRTAASLQAGSNLVQSVVQSAVSSALELAVEKEELVDVADVPKADPVTLQRTYFEFYSMDRDATRALSPAEIQRNASVRDQLTRSGIDVSRVIPRDRFAHEYVRIIGP